MIDAGRLAAAAIRDARLQAGLTQEKAAALRGHATSTISRWENGGLPQTWEELHEYALAIGQPITLRLGPTAKAPPPEWAEALGARIVEELRQNRQLIEGLALPADLVEAAWNVIGRLEALPPQGAVAPDDPADTEGPAGGSPQGRESSSPPVPNGGR